MKVQQSIMQCAKPKLHFCFLFLFFLLNVSNRGLKHAASWHPDSPQVLRVGGGVVQDALLPPKPPELKLQEVNVLHALVVVEVSLAED